MNKLYDYFLPKNRLINIEIKNIVNLNIKEYFLSFKKNKTES